jgi:hypothetical protein
MTVRGGGVPVKTTALMPLCRMGPPPRSLAADAHHCIMVGSLHPPSTRMWHEYSHTTRGLPSDFVIRRQQVCRRAWSRQGSLTQPILDRSCLRAGPLDPCGSGRGNGFARSNKESLDKKLPIQVGHRRRRPAANETLLDCCRVRRHRGRSSLGAVKPEYKLDPGLLEHPRLSPRAVMAPEHAW